MYYDQVKIIIRQEDPNDKTEDATKGGRGAKSIIFMCNGIKTSLIDKKKKHNGNLLGKIHEHFNDYFCCCCWFFI